MKIILDACTLILLAKASILEAFTGLHSICITSSVNKEVMKGKPKLYADALLVERLCEHKKIKVVKDNLKITKKFQKDFNMGIGESSTISFSLKNMPCIIATDNRQGRKAVTINNLPLIGSLEILVSLYKKKKITLAKAKQALNILEQQGWFSSYLIHKAKEDLFHDKS